VLGLPDFSNNVFTLQGLPFIFLHIQTRMDEQFQQSYKPGGVSGQKPQIGYGLGHEHPITKSGGSLPFWYQREPIN